MGLLEMEINEEMLFAWKFFYKSFENSVNTKSDVLIAFVHYLLIRYGNFRCIGIGEKMTVSEEDIGLEVLPDGWNSDDTKCTLRYIKYGRVFLFLCHKSEDCLIMNVVNVKDKIISNISLEPETIVSSIEGSLDTMIPCVAQLFKRLYKELIQPIYIPDVHDVSTQTLTAQQFDDPMSMSDSVRPVGQFIPVLQGEVRHFGFPDIAREIKFN